MLDDHIKMLKKALSDKQPPLKVAETRLAMRTHRPNIEACDDAPHGTLISEVVEINDSIAILTQKLADAEEARIKLIKSQVKYTVSASTFLYIKFDVRPSLSYLNTFI